MLIQRIKLTLRRIKWRLTLSYTTVTIGSLLIVVIMLGYLAFSKVFLPLDIFNTVLTPEDWIRLIRENDSALVNSVLKQEPIDTDLIEVLLREGEFTIADLELLQIGDFQIRLRTAGQASFLLVDMDGILLGTSNPKFVSQDAVGRQLDMGLLPGLMGPFNAARDGVMDPDRLFVTIEPNERFYFSVPFIDRAEQEVLGVGIIYVERLPTANDIPSTLLLLIGRSVLILLLAAGVVGTIFGILTTRGIVARLSRVSKVTDAWSQGDFSEFIDDPVVDEIGLLTKRLNHMAEQLQQLLKRSQEIAVSEERNRLARDLHDSAKQEALAASFHLGTALTIIEKDPETAKGHLVEADNLVNSVRGELTDLIHELRPIAMNGIRFDETINEYIIDWAHQTGIEASLKVNGFVELPLETKQGIYRIMQEALANVARHSAAKIVEVSMDFSENSVVFCISDDGIGFNVNQEHAGMGLDSMRERAESLNGNFRIQSDPREGTKVCITVPFEE
jgi:signal transduction histidine kinase